MHRTPAIYVGTYARYNNGSIAGQWIELDRFGSAQEFYEVCQNLHSDELDPEFMFQDWENIPDRYIGESYMNSDYWEYLQFTQSTYMDDDAVTVGVALQIPLDELEDRYYGHYDSDTDLAYDYVESTGMLSEMSENLQAHFDYERFGRDLACEFYVEDGHYFMT